jgi:hypothetical protein
MGEFIISTSAGDFWIEDGTLMVRVTGPEVTLENAREGFEAVREALSRNHGVKKALVDLGYGVVARRPVRNYLADMTGTLDIDQAALIFHNPVQRIAASFFLGVNKPPVDLGLFADEREAQDWLGG